MIKRDNLSPLEQEAIERLDAVEVPDPESQYTFRGIRVHEVLGPRNECLLMAFGLIPLPRMLEVVNDYHELHAETEGLDPKPWDAADSDKVVDALSRVHYERLAVTVHEDRQPGDAPFTVHWETEGVMPMTTWVVQHSPRDV